MADMVTANDAIIQALLDNRLEQQRLLAALRDKARYLRDRMSALARMIDNGDFDSINGLGEVQSAGVTIDMLCAQLETNRRMRRSLVDARGRITVDSSKQS